MAKNWLKEAIKNVDINDDIAILENPEVTRYLDGLMIDTYWPTILQSLKNNGYIYSPEDNPKIELELSYKLSRALTFMLLDEQFLFYRGSLICTREHWILHNETYLFLSSECDPKVVFEILGNSRFVGNPPSLSISKRHGHFYEIKLNAGKGASWGYYDDNRITKEIQKAIEVSTAMQDFTLDGIITATSIGEFLTMAYEVYEAY
jgi:hypothetical protein